MNLFTEIIFLVFFLFFVNCLFDWARIIRSIIRSVVDITYIGYMRRVDSYPELRENALVERHLSDATAVAMRRGLRCTVAAPHADALRQDLLQLRRCSARDQRPYQRQSVVVEIRL